MNNREGDVATFYILGIREDADGGIEEVEWREVNPSQMPANSPSATVRAPFHDVLDAIDRGDTVTYGKHQGGDTYTPRSALSIDVATGLLVAADPHAEWLDEVRKYR